MELIEWSYEERNEWSFTKLLLLIHSHGYRVLRSMTPCTLGNSTSGSIYPQAQILFLEVSREELLHTPAAAQTFKYKLTFWNPLCSHVLRIRQNSSTLHGSKDYRCPTNLQQGLERLQQVCVGNIFLWENWGTIYHVPCQHLQEEAVTGLAFLPYFWSYQNRCFFFSIILPVNIVLDGDKVLSPAIRASEAPNHFYTFLLLLLQSMALTPWFSAFVESWPLLLPHLFWVW